MVSRCFFYLFSEIYLRISFSSSDSRTGGTAPVSGQSGIAFILIKVHGNRIFSGHCPKGKSLYMRLHHNRCHQNCREPVMKQNKNQNHLFQVREDNCGKGNDICFDRGLHVSDTFTF